VDDRQIEVNAIEVRRALARSFSGHEGGDHAWVGGIGIGDVRVVVDVLTSEDGRPYVHVGAAVTAAQLDGRTARLLVIENNELVFGRFGHAAGQVRVEHAILAGTTMAAGGRRMRSGAGSTRCFARRRLRLHRRSLRRRSVATLPSTW
jgi:hypothetical protein